MVTSPARSASSFSAVRQFQTLICVGFIFLLLIHLQHETRVSRLAVDEDFDDDFYMTNIPRSWEPLFGKGGLGCDTRLWCDSLGVFVLLLVDPAEDPQAKPDAAV